LQKKNHGWIKRVKMAMPSLASQNKGFRGTTAIKPLFSFGFGDLIATVEIPFFLLTDI
jgi:hypothetical protein